MGLVPYSPESWMNDQIIQIYQHKSVICLVIGPFVFNHQFIICIYTAASVSFSFYQDLFFSWSLTGRWRRLPTSSCWWPRCSTSTPTLLLMTHLRGWRLPWCSSSCRSAGWWWTGSLLTAHSRYNASNILLKSRYNTRGRGIVFTLYVDNILSTFTGRAGGGYPDRKLWQAESAALAA